MKPETERQDRILHLPRERETPAARLLPRTSPAGAQAPGLFLAAPGMEALATAEPETVRVMVKKPRRLIKHGA